MTLQELGRFLDKYDSQQLDNNKSLEQLKGKPFYDWNYTTVNDSSMVSESRSKGELSNSTFNHTIGLPRKNGIAYPLFDYEQMLYNALQSNKHIWIKKATGLGVTEFMLRYMAWLCLKDDTYRNACL